MRNIICSLCILLLAASFAGAQESQELPPPGATLKVTTEVVNVYAVVRQKNGRLIPDLNKDDFTCWKKTSNRRSSAILRGKPTRR